MSWPIPRTRCRTRRRPRRPDPTPPACGVQDRNPRADRRVGQSTSSANAPMLLPLLFLLGVPDPAAVYNGRAGRLDVQPPRLEAEIKVGGTLDEAAWAGAALMTGFS